MGRDPKGNDRIPTIHSQVRAASFRGSKSPETYLIACNLLHPASWIRVNFAWSLHTMSIELIRFGFCFLPRRDVDALAYWRPSLTTRRFSCLSGQLSPNANLESFDLPLEGFIFRLNWHSTGTDVSLPTVNHSMHEPLYVGKTGTSNISVVTSGIPDSCNRGAPFGWLKRIGTVHGRIPYWPW